MSRGVDIVVHVEVIDVQVAVQYPKGRVQIAGFEVWVEYQRVAFQDPGKAVFVFITINTLTSPTTGSYTVEERIKQVFIQGYIDVDRTEMRGYNM